MSGEILIADQQGVGVVEVAHSCRDGVGAEIVLEDADVDCRDPEHAVEQLLARGPEVGVKQQMLFRRHASCRLMAPL